jgi:asparagine synthase (glutamine-hydrolysing)
VCGIAGFLGAFEPSVLDRMGALIAHRGPDSEGTWYDPGNRVGLAHRRLAIIDLSPAGHQPMWDLEKRACIVFNGEIYNYRELREELEKDGARFAGHSDTEVLLALYLRDGEKALERLNGIYAFALWDARSRTLVCARDPMGVKPFYWTRTPGGFAFASELKALLPLPGLDRTIDPRAVASHLTLLWAPGALTMFRSVHKLLPGRILRVALDGEPSIRRFASESFAQPLATLSYAEAVEETRRLLRQAVTRQLVSDVPVGGFLSGGVDSSAVASFAVEGLGNPSRYPAFSIGFTSKDGISREGFADDLPFAELMAKHLSVPLRAVWVGDELADQIDWMVWHLDEPTPDPAALNAFQICRLARDSGIKVLLSGTGGDDLFTGYRRHQAIAAEQLWAWLPRAARRGMEATASHVPQRSATGRRIARAFRNAAGSPGERLAGYFEWLDEPVAMSLLSPDALGAVGEWRPGQALMESLRELPGDTPPLNQMLALEQRHFLGDHNLNYNDKMGMACGVEVRVPFLDLDLVAFANRLPPNFKQRGARGKAVLGDALKGVLPDVTLNRSKTGFAVPLRSWIRGTLRPRLEEIASGTGESSGLFSPGGVRALIDADARGAVDAAYPLLGVLCVESWVRQFAGGGVR